MDAISFACPRCGTAAAARFYGPCDRCRTELRATVVVAARDVEVGAYEPSMNVVPNQVATKE